MFDIDSDLVEKSNWRGVSNRRRPFYRRWWFKLLLLFMLAGLVAAGAAVQFVVLPLKKLADGYNLNDLRNLEAASIIYDRKGEEISRLYDLNRTPVEFKEVGKHVVDALISQEDSRFFSHDGVDYIGIVRAMYLNFKAGRETQGASTITQQLARNAFKLPENKYERKVVEAFLARRIEENFSKPQILGFYLNRIYFGGGFYGIQAASKGYFGKDVGEIDLLEAATLCGLIKSPNNIQPLRNPQRALRERNQVLDRMVSEGYLGALRAEELKKMPMVTAPQEGDPRLSYVFDEVRRVLVEQVGEEEAAVGGFQIYTTIDATIQRAAEQAVRKRLTEVEGRTGYSHQTHAQFNELIIDYRRKVRDGVISPDEPRPQPEYLQGASLVVENQTGAILSMVGGRDFIDSQYNRALNTRRPAGTAFVPFVYAAAFSHGDLCPPTLVEDSYVSNRLVMVGGDDGLLGEWGAEEPSQWTMKPMSAREALARGRNSATVKLAGKLGEELGRANAIRANAQQEMLLAAKEANRLAKASGIASPMKDYQSSILGTNEVELDEFCLAYTVFPNLGARPARLHLVERITDAAGNVVFQLDLDDAPLVDAMDTVAAYQVHTCLEDVMDFGTGRAARAEFGLAEFPVAGKTGTHSDFKDLWFLGYTSTVTCGVWVGFDRQKTIYEGAFSSRIALPIWSDTMNVAQQMFASEIIEPPPGVERVELCEKSGRRATDFCFEPLPGPDGKERSIRSTFYEYLRPGTRFDHYCELHSAEGVNADLLLFKRVGSRGAAGDTGKYAHVEPVRMRGLTILGKDPYNSVQPVRRAIPVADDGAEVKRAVPVEPLEEEPEELPIRLSPPPRIFIEADHPTAMTRN
jgi:membrane peptidoglycan carboxypeptidase